VHKILRGRPGFGQFYLEAVEDYPRGGLGLVTTAY